MNLLLTTQIPNRLSHCIKEVHSSTLPVITGICDLSRISGTTLKLMWNLSSRKSATLYVFVQVLKGKIKRTKQVAVILS